MSQLVPIRCPRCLTDGQAPAALDRLLCPVCNTVSAWQPCPICGQRHLVVEGEAVVCPHSPLVPPPSAVPPPPTVAPPVAAVAPSPPATGWGEEPAGDMRNEPSPPPLPAASPRMSGSKRALWIVAGVVVAAAVAVVVFLLVRSGGSDDSTRSVENVVRSELDSHPEARQQACAELRVLGDDRTQVLAMFDSLPRETKASFVESLRQRGRDAGWLPPEAATWQYPEVRRAIVTLFDECDGG